jgi:hypothetical protein
LSLTPLLNAWFYLLPLQKKVFDLLYKIADIPFLSAYKLKIHVRKKEKKKQIFLLGHLLHLYMQCSLAGI